MSEGVIITGSEGTIGKVLTGFTSAGGERPRLDATITRVDARPARGSRSAEHLGRGYNRPAYHDTRNSFIQDNLGNDQTIAGFLQTHSTWVHAAWGGEGAIDPASHNPENLQIVRRILRVQAELGNKALCKLVLPSSVNAHVPINWKRRQASGEMISAHETPTPFRHNRQSTPGIGFTRYGQSKIAMEKAAQTAAAVDRLDIVIPRLGAVNLADRQPAGYAPHIAVAESDDGRFFDLGWEDAVHLRHEDLVANIQTIVDAPYVAGHFALYNLVSDTNSRVHELQPS